MASDKVKTCPFLICNIFEWSGRFFRKPQCYRPSHNFTRYWKYYEWIYEHILIALCRWHVLMAETPEDLQKQLNIFHDYCLAWKLKVNIDKTEIVCFTNGRLPQNLQFTYSNSEVEIV